MMNNGNGAFATKVDYSIGAATVDVVLADLNGDGKADIVTGGGSSVNIYVRMNNGDGTFAAATSYVSGVSTLASALAAADFNNDGAVDIAVQNTNGNTVSVFMNTGNGTLATKVDYSSSDGYGLAVVDVNGDGYVDLVPGIYSSPSAGFAILYNNGNGTFASRVIVSTGVAGYAMTAGDLNNDGKPDVVTGALTNGAINVILSNPRTMIHANAYNGLVSIGTSTATSSNNAILYVANSSSTSATDLFKVSSSTGLVAFNVASNGSIQVGTSTKYGTFNLQAIATTSPIFTLASSTGANVLRIGADGNMSIGGLATSTARLSVSNSTTTVQTAMSGTILHLIGDSISNSRILIDSFGLGGVGFNGRQARGNGAAPTQTQAGDTLVTFGGAGYGQTGYAPLSTGAVTVKAANTFTDTSYGSYMTFETTPTGSTSRVERMRINADGSLSIGTTTIAGGFNYQAVATTSPIFSIASSTGASILRINSNGYVGIGTSTPAGKLSLTGNGNADTGTFSNSSLLITNTGASGRTWAVGTRADAAGANQRFFISDETGSSERLKIDSAGTLSITNNGGAFANTLCSSAASGLVQVGTCTSDERLKTNVVDYSTGTSTSALDAILSLRSVNFNWKDVNADPSVQNGFLAQEIQKVLPGVVTNAGTSTVVNADGSTTTVSGTLGINYNALWAPTIKAIQELNAKVFASKPTAALTIEEITASSTISVDDKLKALGMNAKQVNDMLAQLASSTSATSTTVDIWDANLNATTSTTTETFVGKLLARVIEVVKDLLANVGVAKVKTNEICVKKSDGSDLCLNGDQLQNLMDSRGGNVGGGASNPGGNGNGATGDIVAPTITLNGDASVTVTLGSEYIDAGAVVTDNVDGDLTATVSGDTINAETVAGTYHILYDAVDHTGNHAVQVSREVIVQ
jgi:hypothetical protein